MKIKHYDDYLLGTQFVYYPNLNDEYAFRAWPRKFDIEFLDKLPDPNTTNHSHWVLDSWDDIQNINWNTAETPQDSIKLNRVYFKRITLGYRGGDTTVYCYDWEQVK